jgi:Arc/MetJ-type ribon-helix-helix transcriptional regulator
MDWSSIIVANMKTIAITVDEDTLSSVDALVATSSRLRNRSAVVRAALRDFTEREQRRQTEEREREILRKQRQRLARQARALIAEQARR